jgi:hypothetical protein
MWTVISHDYAHCDQHLCPKKDNCFRYKLYKEDEEYCKEHNVKTTYCTYIHVPAEDVDHCDVFISTQQT